MFSANSLKMKAQVVPDKCFKSCIYYIVIFGYFTGRSLEFAFSICLYIEMVLSIVGDIQEAPDEVSES